MPLLTRFSVFRVVSVTSISAHHITQIAQERYLVCRPTTSDRSQFLAASWLECAGMSIGGVFAFPHAARSRLWLTNGGKSGRRYYGGGGVGRDNASHT
ncbi:hypothetical protein BJ875DRAFT_478617 [Amylocarpus encephaloides]|uniref:Uncharacterized protein n=1 Tax=Amylocarpus encephaloides TaxID=45428 RepID=A0A9P7Y6V9_9HELO|nr:hypothetical protein BJ875DRAFT_478617 [Amylocarpus encephaloides]